MAMTKITILVGFIFLVSCISKPTPIQQETKFEKIFSFPDMSKENLYEKTLQWIGQIQGGEIILYQNSDEGKIIGNIDKEFVARMNSNAGPYSVYSEIDVKEGKIKITLTFPPLPQKEIERNCKGIFKDYESYMNTKKTTDW